MSKRRKKSKNKPFLSNAFPSSPAPDDLDFLFAECTAEKDEKPVKKARPAKAKPKSIAKPKPKPKAQAKPKPAKAEPQVKKPAKPSPTSPTNAARAQSSSLGETPKRINSHAMPQTR